MMQMVTQGIGWGNPCELCPQMNSREYEKLCVEVQGMKRNELIFFMIKSDFLEDNIWLFIVAPDADQHPTML